MSFDSTGGTAGNYDLSKSIGNWGNSTPTTGFTGTGAIPASYGMGMDMGSPAQQSFAPGSLEVLNGANPDSSGNPGGFFSGLFSQQGEDRQMGASPLMQGMQTLTGLGNLYMGMKQYGLARDSFGESKRQYNQNYAAQRTLTNSRMEDRQRARVASNPGAYQSVGSYMQKNQIA